MDNQDEFIKALKEMTNKQLSFEYRFWVRMYNVLQKIKGIPQSVLTDLKQTLESVMDELTKRLDEEREKENG